LLKKFDGLYHGPYALVNRMGNSAHAHVMDTLIDDAAAAAHEANEASAAQTPHVEEQEAAAPAANDANTEPSTIEPAHNALASSAPAAAAIAVKKKPPTAATTVTVAAAAQGARRIKKRKLNPGSSGSGDWPQGMTRDEEIAADERAFVRSLRDRERYAQRERAEAEEYKLEKARHAATDRVFGKKYRSQAEILRDNELERFTDAPIKVTVNEPFSAPPTRTRGRHSDAAAAAAAADTNAVGHDHVPEDCDICAAGWELWLPGDPHSASAGAAATVDHRAAAAVAAVHAAAAAATAATAAAAGDGSETAAEAAVAAVVTAPAPAVLPGVRDDAMQQWCPPFRELDGRVSTTCIQ
jgi:hypothetical protein